MSNQPLSLREQIVELNDAQWQLLERTLIAVMPPRNHAETSLIERAENRLIDQATDSIRKAIKK